MKPFLVVIIFALLFIPCLAQEKELKQFSVSPLELSIANVKKEKERLEIGITLENKSSESILIVLPNINDSSETSYFLALNEKEKTLQVKNYLFTYPSYILDANEPCSVLRIIKAGENYSERFSLGYPMATNSLFFNHKVDISSYKKFSADIGVLPFDNSIYQIQDRRPFGHCVMPNDEIRQGIYKDKTLIDLQRILTAKTFSMISN